MKQEKRDLRKYSKHLRSMEAGETDYGSMGAGKGTDDDNGPRRRNSGDDIIIHPVHTAARSRTGLAVHKVTVP